MSRDTNQPISKETPVTLTIGLVVAAIAAVWFAASRWSTMEAANGVVSINSGKIAVLESSVVDLKISVNKLESQNAAQLSILRYIANGKQGPLPEAAK